MRELLIKNSDPWIATTSGERLLSLLLRYHVELRVISAALAGTGLRLAGRFGDLSDFFVGASVLHLVQRMVKLAINVRTEELETREDQIEELRLRLSNQVGLTPLDYDAFFGELVEEALTSAEQTVKQIPYGVKLRANAQLDHCYSCGVAFDVTQDDGQVFEPTADHLWPRAMGGDSIFENLLPACERCNRAKESLAGWHMVWLQPAVYADQQGLDTIGRDLKIALHMRAAMAYAHQSGSTLRDAYLAIGPRLDPVRIDNDQGYDFFNLRVHDEEATNVSWSPS